MPSKIPAMGIIFEGHTAVPGSSPGGPSGRCDRGGQMSRKHDQSKEENFCPICGKHWNDRYSATQHCNPRTLAMMDRADRAATLEPGRLVVHHKPERYKDGFRMMQEPCD